MGFTPIYSGNQNKHDIKVGNIGLMCIGAGSDCRLVGKDKDQDIDRFRSKLFGE